jgi:hypothetical protein
VSVVTPPTEASNAIEVPVSGTDIHVESGAVFDPYRGACQLIAGVEAVSHDGQVLGGVVLHAVARPDRD